MKRQFAGTLGAVFLLAMACVRPACAESTAQAGLADARAKLDALPAYHLRLEDETGTTEIDYTVPQRVRIFSPSSRVIIVGGAVYLNAGSGWTPSGVNPTLLILMTMLEDDRFISFTSSDEILDQGTQSIEGIVMRCYRIRTPVNGSFLERTVWIGVKDGLPHRIERRSSATKLTATYSQFGKNFAIVPPPGMEAVTQH